MDNIPSATLQFLGGAGSVTGSKYLIQTEKSRVLLDCGLFQGLKDLRLRNWARPAFDPSSLDAVVISHAHIDHTGYLPVLAKNHFRGKIYATAATTDLMNVMLLDSAHLQEEEAESANKYGFSKHKPALPLYTVEDAERVLHFVKRCSFEKYFEITRDIKILFRRSGHILGAASVELLIGKENPVRLVFSGDLGRWGQPIIHDPVLVEEADVLLVESTYGNRLHPTDFYENLGRIVREAVQRGGALIIPAFAVGRTQEMIWLLRKLEEEKKIPVVPMFIDSPMAGSVDEIYIQHPEEHDLEMSRLMSEEENPLHSEIFHVTRSKEESKAINRLEGPMIIISASGMATGGRVVHHLKMRLADPRTTILQVGYQAAGTRGRSLQDGAKEIKIQGQLIPVHARVEMIDGLSAHGDQKDILRWLSGFKKPPRQTYLVHGEAEAANTLAQVIQTQLGWQVKVAVDQEVIPLKP